MNVIKFTGQKKVAHEVLDKLRADIDSGEIIGFIAVAIKPNDDTSAYMAFESKVTRLRAVGAVACLNNAVLNEEL